MLYGKLTEQERKLWSEFMEARNLFLIEQERMEKLDNKLTCKKNLFWATVQDRLKIYGTSLGIDEETWDIVEVEEVDEEEIN